MRRVWPPRYRDPGDVRGWWRGKIINAIRQEEQKRMKINQISRCFIKSTTWGRRGSGVILSLRFQFLRRLLEIPVFLVLSVAFLRTKYFFRPVLSSSFSALQEFSQNDPHSHLFSYLKSQNSLCWFCGCKAPGPTEFLTPPAWIALMDVLKGLAFMFRPGQPRFGLLFCVWIGKGKKFTFSPPKISKFFGLILWV